MRKIEFNKNNKTNFIVQQTTVKTFSLALRTMHGAIACVRACECMCARVCMCARARVNIGKQRTHQTKEMRANGQQIGT